MGQWNRQSGASFFPNVDRSNVHRGIGGDWRMNIAFPPVNISKKKDEFKISIAAPGYDKDDFKIESKNGKLLITATHRTSTEEQTDDYVHREYETHSFEREINIPDDVVTDDIKASYINGVLKISLPRKEEVEKKGQLIPVE